MSFEKTMPPQTEWSKIYPEEMSSASREQNEADCVGHEDKIVVNEERIDHPHGRGQLLVEHVLARQVLAVVRADLVRGGREIEYR